MLHVLGSLFRSFICWKLPSNLDAPLTKHPLLGCLWDLVSVLIMGGNGVSIVQGL